MFINSLLLITKLCYYYYYSYLYIKQLKREGGGIIKLVLNACGCIDYKHHF
jgi:hypothetical protein